MIKNLKTAILHLHTEPLLGLDPSAFGKQRIVAIKKPTSKYSSSAIGRFLAPGLWHSWQGRRQLSVRESNKDSGNFQQGVIH